MHLNRTLAVSLFLGASALAADPKPTQESKPTAAVASACAHVPLFQRYARSGMVDTLPEGQVRLSVVTDVHGADCGNPDCYFTSVKAVFHLSTKGGRMPRPGGRGVDGGGGLHPGGASLAAPA